MKVTAWGAPPLEIDVRGDLERACRFVDAVLQERRYASRKGHTPSKDDLERVARVAAYAEMGRRGTQAGLYSDDPATYQAALRELNELAERLQAKH